VENITVNPYIPALILLMIPSLRPIKTPGGLSMSIAVLSVEVVPPEGKTTTKLGGVGRSGFTGVTPAYLNFTAAGPTPGEPPLIPTVATEVIGLPSVAESVIGGELI
jgi:hypothetical protein